MAETIKVHKDPEMAVEEIEQLGDVIHYRVRSSKDDSLRLVPTTGTLFMLLPDHRNAGLVSDDRGAVTLVRLRDDGTWAAGDRWNE